jgi:putative ABC transport system permease protein
VLVEGLSANHFDVTGAEFAAGRPFTELEDRQAARVCVLGANLARALFGTRASLGREVLLGSERFFVVGQAAPRRGGFFGENRQDNVMAIPRGAAARLFPEAEETVLYIRAEPGRRELAKREAQGLLRQLRGLRPGQDDDFHLSTADQIIAQFDRLSALIGLATVGLAAVSLLIGGIGIANVMIIGVTERTREIGLRLAVGARRREVRLQFLIESALLSLAGGAAGIALAFALGLLLGLAVPGLVATPPLWIVAAGALASMATGLLAGYWPAQQASALDPVEALRHE